MTLFYSDESRAREKYSLPDCEVFWADAAEWAYDGNGERQEVKYDDDGNVIPGQEVNAEGFYWWFCLPGCLPDSEPSGPFTSEELAIADCRESND